MLLKESRRKHLPASAGFIKLCPSPPKKHFRAVLINPDGSYTERSKKVMAHTPMGRFGDISELNGIVKFLCSDEASFITGAVIPVDGGFSSFSAV